MHRALALLLAATMCALLCRRVSAFAPGGHASWRGARGSARGSAPGVAGRGRIARLCSPPDSEIVRCFVLRNATTAAAVLEWAPAGPAPEAGRARTFQTFAGWVRRARRSMHVHARARGARASA